MFALAYNFVWFAKLVVEQIKAETAQVQQHCQQEVDLTWTVKDNRNWRFYSEVHPNKRQCTTVKFDREFEELASLNERVSRDWDDSIIADSW